MVADIKKHKAFTLIEILIAVALVGILGAGITTFAMQTITETKRSSNHMQVIQQLQNAGFWVSRDVQMAQTVTPGPNAGFPLQVDWTDEALNTFQVTFSLSEGVIQRSLVKNGQAAVTTTVARFIDSNPGLTNCTYASNLLTFNVTSKLGQSSMSRSYKIEKRPG